MSKIELFQEFFQTPSNKLKSQILHTASQIKQLYRNNKIDLHRTALEKILSKKKLIKPLAKHLIQTESLLYNLLYQLYSILDINHNNANLLYHALIKIGSVSNLLPDIPLVYKNKKLSKYVNDILNKRNDLLKPYAKLLLNKRLDLNSNFLYIKLAQSCCIKYDSNNNMYDKLFEEIILHTVEVKKCKQTIKNLRSLPISPSNLKDVIIKEEKLIDNCIGNMKRKYPILNDPVNIKILKNTLEYKMFPKNSITEEMTKLAI